MTETIKDNIDRALNGELAISTIIEDSNSQSALKTSRNDSTNDLKVGPLSSEFKINTNDIISPDNLRISLKQQPSSSSNNQPLDKVVLSENYFTHFLLVSSILIFFIGLFN